MKYLFFLSFMISTLLQAFGLSIPFHPNMEILQHIEWFSVAGLVVCAVGWVLAKANGK